MELGHALSSEELGLRELVGHANVSDHYRPWMDELGESPFVRGTLGAIAYADTIARPYEQWPLAAFEDGGFERVHIHRIEPAQGPFLEFCARELPPDHASVR